MKITADGILGSAQNINNKKKSDDKEIKQDGVNLKTDSINIKNVINSRIEAIEKEVKDIQTSLTKNQIISRGIDRLISAVNPNATQAIPNIFDAIMNETRFNNSKILQDFVGPRLTQDAFSSKKNEIDSLISNNLAALTKIRIEMDNIAASDVTGNKKIENLMAGINDTLKTTNIGIENISHLDAEKVMRLVK